MGLDAKGKQYSKQEQYSVHHILAHSYFFYLLLFLLSLFLDLAFPIRIFNNSAMDPIGFLLLILASVLIFWAQKTGRDLRKVKEIKTEHFCRGPYCYTRSPTHWGLFLLMLGFGIIINAFFVVLATLISLVVARLVFLRKEELILTDRYGAPYLEYKKLVKF